MHRLVLPLFLAFTVACGGATIGPTDPTGEVHRMEEMRIVADRSGGELVFESYDAGQLFERGVAAMTEGHCEQAVEQFYERLVREFPTSRFVTPALYNSGLCLHESDQLDAAVPFYERTTEHAPSSRDGRHAAFQLAQVLVRLERWEPTLSLSERLLLRDDLSGGERLEALTRRAQALLGAERVQDARRQASEALSFYRIQERNGQLLEVYFAGAANYVLAESIRTESESMPVPEGTALEQHEVLERRARLLLAAQREYFNTIRHTDAHWAAASGYRIGSMYDALWQSMMSAPVPPPGRELNTAVYEQEYRTELGRRIQPLLRNAISYWEITLSMVDRTGVNTDWTERTQADLERIRGLLLQRTAPDTDEDAARLPTSRLLMPEIPSSLLNPDARQESRAFAFAAANSGDHGRYGSSLTGLGRPSK